jgi:hypothetical protein
MFGKLSAAMTSAVVAVAMLTAVAPAAEGAERRSRVVLHDGTGDVWTGDFSEENDPTRADFPAADVTRAVVRHGTYALRIRMRIADLRKVGTQFYQASIQTPRNEYLADLTSERRARMGREAFFGETRCRAMTHRIDYVNDVLRMRIPRRCLGRPRWVKVTLTNAVVNQRAETFYVDNPHNHQAFPLRSTRRLYRG